MNTKMIRLFLQLLCITTTQQKIYPCDLNEPCGCSLNVASVDARIVNGQTAATNTWSWATSLKIGGYLCGGAVISDSYIMTAGHCVTTASSYEITAYLGSTRRFSGITRDVSRIYLHPRYHSDPSGRYVLNDIALLKLSTPLNMTDRTLAIVCLPKSNLALPVNTDVIAVGWGTTREGGSVSETLQQVTLNIVSSTSYLCTNIAPDTTVQFCAGIMPYGGKGKSIQCSIMSFDIPAGLKKEMNMFTENSNLRHIR
jgi:secreted trypsin-like serine protease